MTFPTLKKSTSCSGSYDYRFVVSYFVICSFCPLGNLDLVGMKQVFKAEGNPWVPPIADQFQVGISHVFDYIRSDTYK